MLIGDIVYNDAFDCNCNYAIYNYNPEVPWYELESIFSTEQDGFTKPLNRILDMKIKYITISNETLILEAMFSEEGVSL